MALNVRVRPTGHSAMGLREDEMPNADRASGIGNASLPLRRGGLVIVALMLVHALIMAAGHDDEGYAKAQTLAQASSHGAALAAGAANQRGNPVPRCFDLLSVVSPGIQTLSGTQCAAPMSMDDDVPGQTLESSLPPSQPPPQTRRALLQVYRI